MIHLRTYKGCYEQISLADLDISIDVVGEVGEVQPFLELDVEPVWAVPVGSLALHHVLRVGEIGPGVLKQETDRLSKLKKTSFQM